ncbi:GAE4 [Symbiodinium microadriaticum]|nr:GAE4 [Symbiodinium microadriaticum]
MGLSQLQSGGQDRELPECRGQMPCVCHKGEPHVETAEILAWIDREFESPALAPSAGAAEKVKSLGIFGAIAGFTKNTDEAADAELRTKLLAALSQLGTHLGAGDGFLAGPE